jgi:hypothetical protein
VLLLEPEQLSYQVRLALQLLEIPPLEPLPPLRPVTEPFPEPIGGRYLLEPEIDGTGALRDPLGHNLSTRTLNPSSGERPSYTRLTLKVNGFRFAGLEI